MIKISAKEKCSGCHACKAVCPKACITMVEDREGFLYPTIDKDVCVDCGLCEKVCPILNESSDKGSEEPAAYAVINTNDDIRKESSSGGVFTLIAEQIFEHDGVVFGAAFNNKNEVEHICVSEKEELYRLRGAKYVQSRIGDTYREAKNFLEAGKLVLYTGTPCQIAGLKSYLGKEYDNLFCQDLVCHGVPSQEVWRRYVEYRETKAGSKIKAISFRNKKHGWKRYSVKFMFENNSVYTKTASKDPYMRAYLSDLCLRPSCYECKFKTLYRQTDVTLADFWGIENTMPEMDDDKGTSLVMIHSDKGSEMLSWISENIVAKETDLDKAVRFNLAAVKSTKLPDQRDGFSREISSEDFAKVVDKYAPKKSKVKKIVKKIVRVVKRK